MGLRDPLAISRLCVRSMMIVHFAIVLLQAVNRYRSSGIGIGYPLAKTLISYR
jgi:hypothetical protein